jgi:hypothetical protein
MAKKNCLDSNPVPPEQKFRALSRTTFLGAYNFIINIFLYSTSGGAKPKMCVSYARKLNLQVNMKSKTKEITVCITGTHYCNIHHDFITLLADPANVVLPYKLFLGNFLV